jgi:hypothetical protein
MTARITSPTGAISVTKYDELEKFVSAFAAGHLNLLILIGPPGVAKSQTVRKAIGEKACWVEGNATAFGIYTKLYHHRDSLVVIDDVDSLYSDRSAVRLIKCVCQTDPVKRVAWESRAVGRDAADVPREFVTTSRVIIIANDWKTLDQNVAAIQDRGHLVEFVPTAKEVHQKAGEWFDEPDIYQWFGEHLHLIPNHSMRLYKRAAELQKAGISWVQHLLAELPEKARLVAELRADPSFTSENERILAFIDRGGGSRATYFNHKKKLRAA